MEERETKISVDPRENEPVDAADGIWSAQLAYAKLDTIPDEAKSSVAGDPGDQQVNWGFRLDDPNLDAVSEGANGSMVFHRTNIEPRKGKIRPTFGQICEALGFDPQDFDTDLVGGPENNDPDLTFPCKVRTKQSIASADGESRTFVNVKEVFKP